MENRTDPDVVQDIVPGDSLFTFIPQDVRMKKGPAPPSADPEICSLNRRQSIRLGHSPAPTGL